MADDANLPYLETIFDALPPVDEIDLRVLGLDPLLAYYLRLVCARVAEVFFERLNRFSFISEDDPEALAGCELALLFLICTPRGIPIDIVAWSPQSGRIGTLDGVAWALGQEWLLRPNLDPDPVPMVYETVPQWLEARGRGLVIFDWDAAAFEVAGVPRLAVADLDFGKQLQQRLTLQPPQIVISASLVKGG
ncbi:MAG TPA: hypothetical protein VIL09_17640 [Microvirga sp.]|jgi:hypothetical protein